MLHSFSVLRPPFGPSLPVSAASDAMARCASMPLKCLPTANPSVSTATFEVASSRASLSTTDGWTPVCAWVRSGAYAASYLHDERHERGRDLDLAVAPEPGRNRPRSAGSRLQPRSSSRRVSTVNPSQPGSAAIFRDRRS